jgi:hypothetical protein
MEKEKLEKILASHKSWLDSGIGKRADLHEADLCGVNLYGANLCRANLQDADLRGADLSSANLNSANLLGAKLQDANLLDADLCNADLRNADLCNAGLCGADLSGANLCCAELYNSNLSGADLCGANLYSANLYSANLRDANLSGADLTSANLCGADLRGANLTDVKYDEYTAGFALQCPEDGSFVGWKKCANGVLVKLLIPEDAKRSSATSRKCRASKAVVLEVIGAEKAISMTNPHFVYEVGKEVLPDSFDDYRWNECSHGIHFFLTRKEAEQY